MKLTVEVKQPVGEVKKGISKKGQPYVVATQEVAVFMPEEDYPTVVMADVKVDIDSNGETVHWYKPGRYLATLKLSAGRFGDAEFRIQFRSMVPFVAAAERKAA